MNNAISYENAQAILTDIQYSNTETNFSIAEGKILDRYALISYPIKTLKLAFAEDLFDLLSMINHYLRHNAMNAELDNINLFHLVHELKITPEYCLQLKYTETKDIECNIVLKANSQTELGAINSYLKPNSDVYEREYAKDDISITD